MSIYNISTQQFYIGNNYLEEAYNKVDGNNNRDNSINTYYTNR
jgi:hypothetical protein